MRRKDRMMDEEFAYYVIDTSPYASLAMVDSQGEPYSLPISIVRRDKVLYFHSAKEGRKVDILNSGPRISLSFVRDISIPENYSREELTRLLDQGKIGQIISSVFTTEFASALVLARVSLVEDPDEAIQAMEMLCRKYTPDKMEFFPAAIEASLSRLNVYRLDIEEVSSKRKKYDDQGVEMKFQRMD